MDKKMLAGRKVAVVLENEYIPEEISAYSERFGELGADVHFLSRLWGNQELTLLSDAINEPSRTAKEFRVTRDIGDVHPEDYDAIIMAANYTSVRLRYFESPAGQKPSAALATSAPAVKFFASAMNTKNIVKGMLCHGLWILTPRPDLLKGREVTCHEVVLSDIVNAGAKYVPAPTGVHVDGDLVTGRSKDEVYLFIDTIAQEITRNAKPVGTKLNSPSGGVSRSESAILDHTVEKIAKSLLVRFGEAVSNFSAARPVSRPARALLDGTLDIAGEVKRMIGVEFAAGRSETHKPILLIASKFGVWASEVTLVASTLLKAGYSVTLATEDGSPPHFLGPSLDPDFKDGAWRGSVVSLEERELALRFLNPSSSEHSLLKQPNIVDLRQLAKPPQVGDYLNDRSLLEQYSVELRKSLSIAEKFDAIIVAGGSGAVPGLMADRGLQNLILAFHDLGKPVMGECNGGLAIAQTIDPATGKSILSGRAVTTHSWLDEYQSNWGWTAAFASDPGSYWQNGVFDLKAYSAAENWIAPGISGNPLIDSEALFKNAARPGGYFFSPAGTAYSVVVDGNLITCRTTPDGYPGVLALMAIMDGAPPLRGRFFIHRDEQGSVIPVTL